jgi:hypothetical protein
MKKVVFFAFFAMLANLGGNAAAQGQEIVTQRGNSFYDLPPRWLVDVPTAGTLHRGYYVIGMRIYPDGGGLGYIDIGLSSRFMLGISYGAESVISNREPTWNPRIGFSVKLRVVDELEYFPAITIGYTDQGFGVWNDELDRYTFKSRGFYAVSSRSFYFYKWTSGWHGGINYSLEKDEDHDDEVNCFVGIDATFNYNLGLVCEYDFALNDNKSDFNFCGKGRGYLNASIKWLFADNLEIEIAAKDLLVNRRESDTFTREIRITYIDSF